ncbi:DUF6263 family protein [Aureivirga marina]|uniref:DUF6263 family protein n=1 Tax=Aureivirga marina TaxID=1182451 RepID=UPI0018CBCB45|nr:DUF6263 family protein [Aureivirga marina]
MKKVLFLLGIFLISLSTFAQKVNLELNLEKGKTYYQNSEITTNISQNVQGTEIKIDVIASTKMAYKVIDEAKGIYSIECSFDNLSSEIKTPQGNVTFSSETENPIDPNSKFYNLLKKESFQIQISKKGKIISVNNLEGIIDRVLGKGEFTEIEKSTLKSSLESNFGKDQIKGNLQLSLGIYPENKTRKGDSWSKSQVLKTTSDIDINITYTLANITKELNTIDAKGELKTAESDEFILSSGVFVRPNLAGTYEATIKLDAKTGWVSEMTAVQKLSGETDVKYTKDGEIVMKIPITTTTNSKVTE